MMDDVRNKKTVELSNTIDRQVRFAQTFSKLIEIFNLEIPLNAAAVAEARMRGEEIPLEFENTQIFKDAIVRAEKYDVTEDAPIKYGLKSKLEELVSDRKNAREHDTGPVDMRDAAAVRAALQQLPPLDPSVAQTETPPPSAPVPRPRNKAFADTIVQEVNPFFTPKKDES